MLWTTMFDQKGCTGRNTILAQMKGGEFKLTWSQIISHFNIDEKVEFQSVILEPMSELALTTAEGKTYTYTNFEDYPSCYDLDEGKF